MMNLDMYFDGWTHRVITVRSDSRRNVTGGRRDSHGGTGSNRSETGPGNTGNQ